MEFCILGLFHMLASIFHTFESIFAKIIACYQQVKFKITLKTCITGIFR